MLHEAKQANGYPLAKDRPAKQALVIVAIALSKQGFLNSLHEFK